MSAPPVDRAEVDAFLVSARRANAGQYATRREMVMLTLAAERDSIRAQLATARESALREAAAQAKGAPCVAAGTPYQTSGNGRFWDFGNDYDQGRIDAATDILTLIKKGPTDEQ